MLIGTVQLELYIPETFSLKEKRFVMQSVKKKLRNQFNVSVAETEYQDKWQKAVLGIACVSNDRRFLDTTLSKVVNAVHRESRVEVIQQVIEIL